MIRLILLLALLIAGLVIGPWLMGNTGYVLIAMGRYTIEMSVVSLGISLLVLLGLIWCLDWLVRRLARSFGSSRSWFSDRSGRRANKKASKAWAQLWQGQYGQAGAALAAAVPHSQLPDLPRLAAAYAEHRAGDKAERDRLLAELDQPLARAALLLQLGDLESARQAFDALEEGQRQGKSGNQLAARLALAEGDLAALWPHLDSLTDAEQDRYHLAALKARIGVAAKEGQASLSRLEQVLDKHSRQQPEVLADLAGAYAAAGARDKALDLLMPALKRDPHPALLAELAALAGTEDAAELQRQLLKWHHKRDNDPALLATLGQLSARQGDLKEARRYLEAALQLKEEPQWRLALAQILERLGNLDAALAQYRTLA
ncbi:heme biosynthesis HemY N-terminal domain-containing protein [Gallaecimonas kandeliae]|uniref:heme biosynthesis HemY N-terminal domain-containing protein n=1 Tax=Gallaecimonas kandeliae TaxID=3029055 RepID=UPI0026475C4F|nr:heme biosynthesis HemY N-terminal domain-containing protein [Gallaecimonas kandeliae]WKE65564.1 heme biosynthesis HemY N-terminal domain-containing protein [Gallaecimonas kandeliae]